MIATDTNVLITLLVNDDAAIARAIEGALVLPGVLVEYAERVKLAFAAVAYRIDIADALHVSTASADTRAFATFDRNLARRGKGHLGPIEILYVRKSEFSFIASAHALQRDVSAETHIRV